MSTEMNPADRSNLEAQLKGLCPAAPGLDAGDFLFRAGAASRTPQVRFWQRASMLLGSATAVLVIALFLRPAPPPLDRPILAPAFEPPATWEDDADGYPSPGSIWSQQRLAVDNGVGPSMAPLFHRDGSAPITPYSVPRGHSPKLGDPSL